MKAVKLKKCENKSTALYVSIKVDLHGLRVWLRAHVRLCDTLRRSVGE